MWTSINTALKPSSNPTPRLRGLNEDVIRLISAKKNEPDWMLEWVSKLSPLADDGRAAMGARRLPQDRLQRDFLLLGAEGALRSMSIDDVDPELLKTYEKLAFPCASRKSSPACRSPRSPSTPCSIRLCRHHLQGRAEEGRRDLHVDLGSAARHPETGAQIYRLRGSGDRQLLCDAEQRRLHRRFFRLRAQGRALPDGAVDLFPHQRKNTASSNAR